jgi:hypothetical protein
MAAKIKTEMLSSGVVFSVEELPSESSLASIPLKNT